MKFEKLLREMRRKCLGESSVHLVVRLLDLSIVRPGFYLTFWQLSTYDLAPPISRYEEELNNLNSLCRQEEALRHSAERSSDRAKRALGHTHRERARRLRDFVELLTKEMGQHVAAREFSRKRLAREKQHWFAHGKLSGSIRSSTKGFIRRC